MELKLYLQMLRRGWWVILLTTLVALITSLLISFLILPQYEAVARFILSPSTTLLSGPNTVLDSLNTLDRTSVMATYAEVMNSDRIYNDAIAGLQLKPEIAAKEYTYQTTVLPNSSVLELRVKGSSPKMAADIANSIGYQTIVFTQRINQVINIDFLDIAVAPVVPIRPQPLRDASLAMVLGLVGGVVLAILRDQLLFSLDAFRQRFYLDDVTGVYKKQHFSRLLEEELAKNPEDILCIGILELNGLRDLIETFPTIALQRILQIVTESLRNGLRGNDIIGRWNEFSFVVMLPNTTGMAAKRIFDRIFQALSEPIYLDQFDIVMNLDSHIGSAEYGNHITMQELFEKASSALEQARRDSKNPVYVWELKNPFWAQKADN